MLTRSSDLLSFLMPVSRRKGLIASTEEDFRVSDLVYYLNERIKENPYDSQGRHDLLRASLRLQGELRDNRSDEDAFTLLIEASTTLADAELFRSTILCSHIIRLSVSVASSIGALLRRLGLHALQPA